MQTSKPFGEKEYLTNTNNEKFDEIERQVELGKLLTRTFKTGQTKSINTHICIKFIQTYIDHDLNELY